MRKRNAFVTGAGSGIGRAISLALVETHHVAMTDLSVEGLAATAEEMPADASHSSTELDVTDSERVGKIIGELESALGSIDVLVNCAGWDELMPFLDTDEAFWDKIIDLNFKSVLRTTHAALPGMMERRYGRIINIASDAGRVGSSLEGVYSGAKGAVIAFTKTIAREAARQGVTANCVCPGPTQTPLLDQIVEKSDDGDRVISSMARGVPMKRLGKPEDVSAAVAFLASEQADFITGQTLSVSGGLVMS